jgi:hypothetical protein
MRSDYLVTFIQTVNREQRTRQTWNPASQPVDENRELKTENLIEPGTVFTKMDLQTCRFHLWT